MEFRGNWFVIAAHLGVAGRVQVSEMKTQDVPLICGDCKHQWTDQILVECSLTLAAARFHELGEHGCPSCRSGKVCFFTGAPATAPT